MHNFPTCQLVLLLAATMATSLVRSLLSHLQLLEHVLTDEGAATTPVGFGEGLDRVGPVLNFGVVVWLTLGTSVRRLRHLKYPLGR